MHRHKPQDMKEVNGQWYSRHEFSNYKTRAKINFKLLDESEANFGIYTTETDKDEIRKLIKDSGELGKKMHRFIEFVQKNWKTHS